MDIFLFYCIAILFFVILFAVWFVFGYMREREV